METPLFYPLIVVLRMKQIRDHYESSLLVVGVNGRKVAECISAWMMLQVCAEFKSEAQIQSGGEYSERMGALSGRAVL